MNGSLSSITSRMITAIVVSLVMIGQFSSIGVFEHHAHAAQRNLDVRMVDQGSLELPVNAAQDSPCMDHMSTAACNDMQHFGTPRIALSHRNRSNEAKCNDMRHFGSFANQSYAEVCQP